MQRQSRRKNCAKVSELDQPDYVQFAVFVKNAVKGEVGLSLKQGRLVSTLIRNGFQPRWSWRWSLVAWR